MPMIPLRLVLSCFQLLRGHLILLDDVHGRTPARSGVTVEGVDERLADAFEQLVWLQVGSPQGFAHAVQLFGTSADHRKIVRLISAANQVHVADEWLEGFRIQASNDRLNEIRAEATLVQETRQHCGERFRCHGPVFADLVQIFPEQQAILDRQYVRLQPHQTDIHVWIELENFAKVGGDRLRLHAEAFIGGDGHAVLPFHRCKTGGNVQLAWSNCCGHYTATSA